MNAQTHAGRLARGLHIACIQLENIYCFAADDNGGETDRLPQIINPAVSRRVHNNVTVVFGKPGTGKSTLRESMEWAFYGDLPSEWSREKLLGASGINHRFEYTEAKAQVHYLGDYGLVGYGSSIRYQFGENGPEALDESHWMDLGPNILIKQSFEEIVPRELIPILFYDGENSLPKVEKIREALIDLKGANGLEEAYRAIARTLNQTFKLICALKTTFNISY